MCTAKRFHVDDEEQNCRVGSPGGPGSLTHYNKFPLPHDTVTTVWRNAGVRLRRDPFFHDLITQTYAEAFSMELRLLVLLTPL